jgi:hypothetical protein
MTAMADCGWAIGCDGVIVVATPKFTVLEMGRWTGEGRTGDSARSSASCVYFVSSTIPYGDVGGGACDDGEVVAPPAGDMGGKPGIVGESPSIPPP